MSEAGDIQIMTIAGRHWRVRPVRLDASDRELQARIAAWLHEVDVLCAWGELDDLRRIENHIEIHREDWSARIAADGNQPVLLIGPRALLARFLAAFGLSAAGPPSPAHDVEWGTYPRLPPLSDTPVLPGEGEIDPFGQDRRRVLDAWREIARSMGYLLRQSHAEGIAFALPVTGVFVDPGLKPWETITRLDETAVASTDVGARDRFASPMSPAAHAEIVLMLMQRALLVCSARGSGAEDRMEALLVAAEELGYLLASNAANPEDHDHVVFDYYIGDMVALLHKANILHGDIHRENFGWQREQRRMLVLDVGSVCKLRRPPTPEEKLRDLAVFKPQCTAEQWEAVKLGYRGVDPQGADELFVGG